MLRCHDAVEEDSVKKMTVCLHSENCTSKNMEFIFYIFSAERNQIHKIGCQSAVAVETKGDKRKKRYYGLSLQDI